MQRVCALQQHNERVYSNKNKNYFDCPEFISDMIGISLRVLFRVAMDGRMSCCCCTGDIIERFMLSIDKTGSCMDWIEGGSRAESNSCDCALCCEFRCARS